MRFTILTATYNRAHTLPDTYQSLCAQTFRDYRELARNKVPLTLRLKSAINAARFSALAVLRDWGFVR